MARCAVKIPTSGAAALHRRALTEPEVNLPDHPASSIQPRRMQKLPIREEHEVGPDDPRRANRSGELDFGQRGQRDSAYLHVFCGPRGNPAITRRDSRPDILIRTPADGQFIKFHDYRSV
jgi:hypothetical protein